MNEREVVMEALQALKAIREGEHGKVEDSVADGLDQIIASMEMLTVHGSSREMALKALIIFGHAIELVGAVTTVMELMSRCGK